MRRAARRDEAEPAIVAALRAAGATVEVMGQPVDLLVGYRDRTFLLEVKTPGSTHSKRKAHHKHRTTARQEDWRAAWKGGPVCVVTSPESALYAIGAVPRPEAA